MMFDKIEIPVPEWTRPRWFIGIRHQWPEETEIEVFKCMYTPIYDTHGGRWQYAIGPYRTKWQAMEAADSIRPYYNLLRTTHFNTGTGGVT